MSESQVEEIKSRLNIVDVISTYIRLQKAGVNFRALCPFHNEKTPSFMISPARQSWHCFGCSEGGDIFSFVQKIEGVDFLDALKTLAHRAGVTLKFENTEARSEKTQLFNLCEIATQYFENNLAHQKPVLEYLAHRGVTDATKKEWRLGYALDSWSGLFDFLKARNLPDSEIEKAGLIIRGENNRFHDRFRNRLIFPIFDISERVIGFSGRAMGEIIPAKTEKADTGKYVNSPETPLFNKSRVLYGFDKAKLEIRKQGFAVLVEGQFDLILPWQDGVKNIVATSGTALTTLHLEILKRVTDNLILAFDMDEAGSRATKRGIDLALETGFSIKVLTLGNNNLSESKDPADFVKSFPGEINKCISQAKPIMEYYFTTVLTKFDPEKLDGKKAIAQILLPEIKRHTSSIERNFWVNELAQKIGVRESDLEAEMARIVVNSEVSYVAPVIRLGTLKKTRKEILSERTLALILKYPHLSNRISSLLDFIAPKYSQIAAIFNVSQNEFNFSKIKSKLTLPFNHQLDYLVLISEITFQDIGQDFNAEKEIDFLTAELEKEHTREILSGLEISIKQAEKENPSLLKPLLEEFQMVYKKLIK